MTDLAALRAGLAAGELPASIRDASPQTLRTLSAALTLDLSEGRAAIDDVARLRCVLIAFGALSPDDHVTGVIDLIEVLLPPAEG